MSTRGRFITLEGGEGVGKSTLARGLADVLAKRGIDVLLTREPGGTPGADLIRSLLLNGDTGRWSPMAETLLFAAARSDHLDNVIRPALARGQWVLCDRYTDSTRAYQSAAGGVSREMVDQIHAMIGADPPDVTLILDLPPAAGLARSRGAEANEARFEAKGADFHAKVRQAFLDIAAADQRRCAIIDTSQPVEKVLADALAVLDNRL